MTRLGALAAVLLLVAAPAVAQDSSGAGVAAALARVAPGSVLRVQSAAGAVIDGGFRLLPDSIAMLTDAGERRVAFADVRSAWQRQRETRTGALTGAVLGGAAGGAFLGLMGLLVGETGSGLAVFAGIGALGGAAAGGLLGGVVGAAVPRWTLVWPPDGGDRPPPPVTELDEEAPRTQQATRRRLGSLEAAAGYGGIGGDEATSGGPGGRLALHAEFGTEPREGSTTRFLSLGPEVSRFELGSTGRIRRAQPPSDTVELTRRFTATAAGGVLRAGLASTGWRAYGLLGLSYNRWDIEERDVRWVTPPDEEPFRSGQSRFEHLGYTAGAGAQTSVARRTGVGIEVRHTAIGTFDMDLPGSYWTVSLTASRRW